jgi:hypothetical protein
MSRLDELPPDQRAALSLLLRQRKSYAEVAVLLGITEGAVRDRAHAALAVLAVRQARELTPEQRQEVADYMLAQQRSISERLTTRTFLGNSEPARAWAQALATELSALAGVALPEVPPAAATPAAAAPAPPSASSPHAVATPARAQGAASGALADAVVAAPSETQPPSSRVGGALVLGAIVVAVVVAVILITGSGSSHKSSASHKTAAKAVASAETVVATVELKSPDSKSRSVGEAEVRAKGNVRTFAIIVANLPATHHFYYAVWLYNSPTSFVALARAPAVGSNRGFAAVAPLPSYAREYDQILLTRETASKPTSPGHVILKGALSIKE